MKICPYCGCNVSDTQKKCPNCGAPILDTDKVIAPSAPKVAITQTEEESLDVESASKHKVICICFAVVFIIILIGVFSSLGKQDNNTNQQTNDNNTVVNTPKQPTDSSSNNSDTTSTDNQASTATATDSESNSSSGQEDYDTEAVRKTFENYVNKWAEAVNNSDFLIVTPYLKEGSPLYRQQQKLLVSLSKQGIKEVFLTGSFSSAYNPYKNVIEGKAYEKYKVSYPSGYAKYIDNYFIYTIDSASPYQLIAISSGSNPYKNTATEDGWVSSDNTALKLEPSDDSITLDTLSADDHVVILEHIVAKDGSSWVHVRHKTCGLAWIREEKVTWPDV